MIAFPHIQIRQQYAKLGFDADPATMEQKQPKATFEMRYVKPKLDIVSPRGDLQIDQSKAWDAYGRGGHLAMMNRIYKEAHNVVMQGIARRVEQGNRLWAIHKGGNAIKENAKELVFQFPEFEYEGPAAYDNVDIHYTAQKPQINVERGRVELNTQVNRPELSVQRGKLDMYMQQYAKVEIIPPELDVQI